MAGRDSSAQKAQPAPKAQPQQGRPQRAQPQPSPDLGVLDRRHVHERARRRQARALLALSALCIAGPLMSAAVGHAFVASAQVKADALQSQISTALQLQQDLRLQKAELTSPDRVLQIAEHNLHMVVPATVTYLAPLDPGRSVLASHGPGSTGLLSSPPQNSRSASPKSGKSAGKR
jgi:hypothetical protein